MGRQSPPTLGEPKGGTPTIGVNYGLVTPPTPTSEYQVTPKVLPGRHLHHLLNHPSPAEHQEEILATMTMTAATGLPDRRGNRHLEAQGVTDHRSHLLARQTIVGRTKDVRPEPDLGLTRSPSSRARMSETGSMNWTTSSIRSILVRPTRSESS